MNTITIDTSNEQGLRWADDLSPVMRRYVVRDDQGRYGLAYEDPIYHYGMLMAHPIDVPSQIVSSVITSDGVGVIMTDTRWHRNGDIYVGMWYDDSRSGHHILEADLRTLTIIDDLGYKIPDRIIYHNRRE